MKKSNIVVIAFFLLYVASFFPLVNIYDFGGFPATEEGVRLPNVVLVAKQQALNDAMYYLYWPVHNGLTVYFSYTSENFVAFVLSDHPLYAVVEDNRGEI